MTPAEIAVLQPQIPDWQILEQDGVQRLERTVTFRDFAGALAFANAVGDLAAAEDHHPRLVIEWGNATVSWWTHKIGGLHRNDFIMAAKTDQLITGDGK